VVRLGDNGTVVGGQLEIREKHREFDRGLVTWVVDRDNQEDAARVCYTSELGVN
jgi:hypothetical protein